MNQNQTQNLLIFAKFYGLFDRPVQRVVELYNNHVAVLMAAQITGHNYV
jgi:hypothetical protein